MSISFAARVEKGIPDSNDDRILVNNQILEQDLLHDKCELPLIAAVCDGCGGYKGGGLAAETVLKEFLSKDAVSFSDSDSLLSVFKKCNKAVTGIQEKYLSYSEMCTTIAGCVFLDEHILVFHAGDSRVYRFINSFLAKMTKDHSAVQNMIDLGQISADEAKRHPRRNVINRCFGMECALPEIYVTGTGLRQGEKFMICSDGLWEYVTDDEICSILSSELSLEQMVDKMITTALKHGSNDNISVCIISSELGGE